MTKRLTKHLTIVYDMAHGAETVLRTALPPREAALTAYANLVKHDADIEKYRAELKESDNGFLIGDIWAPKPRLKADAKPRTGDLADDEKAWLLTHGWTATQLKTVSPAKARRYVLRGETKRPRAS